MVHDATEKMHSASFSFGHPQMHDHGYGSWIMRLWELRGKIANILEGDKLPAVVQ